METVNRCATYRLYPTPAQAAVLDAQREAHRVLYNAALEQRRAAWKRQRLKGWRYPTHGDGWRLLPREGMQHGRLRLSGIGHVRIRGDARTVGEPKTCAILYRHGTWYASITLACQPQRARGVDRIAFDWGVETFATIASTDSAPVAIANPRFLGQSDAQLKAAYRARDTKHKFSRAWRLANKRIARLHAKIARQRLDFHHKQAAQMVESAAAIFTEKLQPANMTRRPKPKQDPTTDQSTPNGAAAKAGLNKAILASAPAQFLSIIRYKAAEADVVYAEAPTRQLKPSQRCHACDTVAKKALAERWHSCPCGASCGRDVNAALVLLHWGMRQTLSVFLASLWLQSNGSQELTPGLCTQNLHPEP